MKTIVNKNTLEIVSESTLRSLHPNVSFPQVLSEASLEGTDYVLKDNPPLPSLSDYQRVEVVATNQDDEVILSYVVITDAPTLDILLKNYEDAIDSLIDAKAKEYKYNNVYTMISYRNDPNPKFAQEAESMFVWRSAVWTKANDMLQVWLQELSEKPSTIPPSIEDLIKELPEFVLV